MKIFPLIPAMLAALSVASCTDNDFPGNDREAGSAKAAAPAPVAPAEEAVNQAALTKVYPATLTPAETTRVLEAGATQVCSFSYTKAGHPVLVYSSGESARALMKLNGKLVTLEPIRSDGDAATFASGPVRAGFHELDDGGFRRSAEMIFEIGNDVRLGFHGFSSCRR